MKNEDHVCVTIIGIGASTFSSFIYLCCYRVCTKIRHNSRHKIVVKTHISRICGSFESE